MYFLKKGQKIRAWVDPPPSFGQCPKENVFLDALASLDLKLSVSQWFTFSGFRGPISVSFLICTSGKEYHSQAGSTRFLVNSIITVLQVIQVIQVVHLIQLIQVVQVWLPQLWPDFRVTSKEALWNKFTFILWILRNLISMNVYQARTGCRHICLLGGLWPANLAFYPQVLKFTGGFIWNCPRIRFHPLDPSNQLV